MGKELNFRNLKLDALRKKCKENGLPTSGKRSDLIEQLEEYFSEDAYKSFQGSMISVSDRLYTLEKTIQDLQNAKFDPATMSSPNRSVELDDAIQQSYASTVTSNEKNQAVVAAVINNSNSRQHLASTENEQTYNDTNMLNAELFVQRQQQQRSNVLSVNSVNTQYPANVQYGLSTSTSYVTSQSASNAFNKAQNTYQHFSTSPLATNVLQQPMMAATVYQHHNATMMPSNIVYTATNVPMDFQNVNNAMYSQSAVNYNTNYSGNNLHRQYEEPRLQQRHVNFVSQPQVYGFNQNLSTNAHCPTSRHFHENNINPYSDARDIISLLPIFDPSSEKCLDSRQFIQRVELLKNAYNWNDKVVIYGVQQKMQGAAKYWIDSQQEIFMSWSRFKEKFLFDFPHITNEADVHVAMSKMNREFNESPQDYFYKMLAYGRRGGLSESSICRHIINGINNYNLKHKISNNCNACNELLYDITTFCLHNDISPQNVNKFNKSTIKVENKNKPITKPAKTEIPNIKCFNCNQLGHYANKCPEPQKKTRCEICKRTTLQTNSCPQKKVDDQRTSVNKVDDHNPNPNVKSSDLVKTIRVNGLFTNCFVEPGSCRSLIRKSFAEYAGISKSCTVTLNGFAGGQCKCDEMIMADLVIDNSLIQHALLIVADELLSENVLLDRDVICQEGKRFIIEDSECFAESTSRLGKCDVVQMEIELSTKRPINVKPYRVPFAKRSIVNKLIKELLDYNIIRPSTPPSLRGLPKVE